jgi:hypothetical protein
MAIHITPNGKEGWKVLEGGCPKPLKTFDTQKEAITYGTMISRKTQDECVIHGRNGQIREKNSYGNDPCPPKDKR